MNLCMLPYSDTATAADGAATAPLPGDEGAGPLGSAIALRRPGLSETRFFAFI